MVLMEDGLYIYGNEVLVSVTSVVMSPDLRLAKIYLSIFNAANKEEVLTAVRQNLSSLKQSLVSRIRKHVRFIPDVAVYNDDLLDEMYQVDKLLENL